MRRIRGREFKVALGIYRGSYTELCLRSGAWQTENIIARELADEIVKGSEAGVSKISKGLFRYTVEVEMIIMILSEMVNIPRDIIEKYRKEAIRNVRRTRGKINLDDLIARNNREFAEQKLSAEGSTKERGALCLCDIQRIRQEQMLQPLHLL